MDILSARFGCHFQLVRYAFQQIERLDCVCTTARQYFNLWRGQWHRDISDRQKELMSQIVEINFAMSE